MPFPVVGGLVGDDGVLDANGLKVLIVAAAGAETGFGFAAEPRFEAAMSNFMEAFFSDVR